MTYPTPSTGILIVHTVLCPLSTDKAGVTSRVFLLWAVQNDTPSLFTRERLTMAVIKRAACNRISSGSLGRIPGGPPPGGVLAPRGSMEGPKNE
jgi:hypothetical protein